MPETERAKKVKAKTVAANLIPIIKRRTPAGVNAQPVNLIDVAVAMELAGIRKYFFS